MIIGYQVVNADGEIWNNRPSFKVLSEATAIEDLQQARRLSSDTFTMIAVLRGDIENPEFENEASATDDQYRTIGASVEHLTNADRKELALLALENGCNMVMERQTGWFVKLYNEPNSNHYRVLSKQANQVLENAYKAGYLCVEFDIDANYQHGLVG